MHLTSTCILFRDLILHPFLLCNKYDSSVATLMMRRTQYTVNRWLVFVLVTHFTFTSVLDDNDSGTLTLKSLVTLILYLYHQTTKRAAVAQCQYSKGSVFDSSSCQGKSKIVHVHPRWRTKKCTYIRHYYDQSFEDVQYVLWTPKCRMPRKHIRRQYQTNSQRHNVSSNSMQQSPHWQAGSHSADKNEFPSFYVIRSLIIVFTP